jgi:undecaprenyl-diphosphatase
VPSLNFRLPIGFNQGAVIHWSSFPSDHAVLYFALSTVVFLVSRKAGIFAYCFTFLVVCLPRMYLGLHYPTDILAGELLGIGVACLFARKPVRDAIASPLLHWLEVAPGSFYGFFYLSSFILATNVESLRVMLGFAVQVIFGQHHPAH